MLLVPERFRTGVREYVVHYHTERNHQGLDGRLLEPPANDSGTGTIDCRERLGGLLRFYRRQAA
jgi:putative transposase